MKLAEVRTPEESAMLDEISGQVGAPMECLWIGLKVKNGNTETTNVEECKENLEWTGTIGGPFDPQGFQKWRGDGELDVACKNSNFQYGWDGIDGPGFCKKTKGSGLPVSEHGWTVDKSRAKWTVACEYRILPSK